MAKSHIRFCLEHEGGASDEVYETFAANVPRVGEFVTVGTTRLIHQEVFDVNWEYGPQSETATVWLVCQGDNEYCEWDCDSSRRYKN